MRPSSGGARDRLAGGHRGDLDLDGASAALERLATFSVLDRRRSGAPWTFHDHHRDLSLALIPEGPMPGTMAIRRDS
jgi:hypothetical protein